MGIQSSSICTYPIIWTHMCSRSCKNITNAAWPHAYCPGAVRPEAASRQKEPEARSSTHETELRVERRIRVQVISSEGGYGKGEGFFVTKWESIFFPDFLAFPIYTKYLDHCVANKEILNWGKEEICIQWKSWLLLLLDAFSVLWLVWKCTE